MKPVWVYVVMCVALIALVLTCSKAHAQGQVVISPDAVDGQIVDDDIYDRVHMLGGITCDSLETVMYRGPNGILTRAVDDCAAEFFQWQGKVWMVWHIYCGDEERIPPRDRWQEVTLGWVPGDPRRVITNGQEVYDKAWELPELCRPAPPKGRDVDWT
jgi:hypothetical protein